MSQATSQLITADLRRWIVDQAQAGFTADAVLASMKASGWHEDTALAAMEEAMLGHVQKVASGEVDAVPPSIPAINTLAGNTLWAHDREVRILMALDHPRVVMLGNVLSQDECDALIDLAGERLGRSETVVNETGGNEVHEARTSRGMFFGRAENELVDRIEKRLSVLTQWPIENGEGLQVLHYSRGAQYKPHFDYFDPEQPGAAAVLRRGGQRVGTVVLYLNTPEHGGGTVFPDAGLTVHPAAGCAAFFSYALPDPGTKTLHGGAPVEVGEKWVATKWMRQGRFD
jgi:prolyl 4-hydroxylase